MSKKLMVISMPDSNDTDSNIKLVEKLRYLFATALNEEIVLKIYPITADPTLLSTIRAWVGGGTGFADVNNVASKSMLPNPIETELMADDPAEFFKQYTSRLHELFDLSTIGQDMQMKDSFPIIMVAGYEMSYEYVQIIVSMLIDKYDFKETDIDKFVKKVIVNEKKLMKWMN